MKKIDFDYSLRIKLRKEKNFFGPGVMELLKIIGETRSINLASRKMGMSYNKAWRIIQLAEQGLGYSLIIRSVGGSFGGGSELTPEAIQIMDQYELFQQQIYAYGDKLFQEIFIEEQEVV